MPVQINDRATTLSYSADNETLIIAPGVDAGDGVQSSFAGSILVNYGNILAVGTPPAAVSFFDTDAVVYNMAGATITGDTGLRVLAEADEIHNDGTIFGTNGYGVIATGNANNVFIANTGLIYGRINGVSVIASAASAVSVNNSGAIRGEDNGIWLTNSIGAAPAIVNSGTIEGRTNSIFAQVGDRLNVTNTGSLMGNVVSWAVNQPDLVTNNGSIVGNVLLETGNDIYKGIGSVTGWVFGEDGVDNLSGGNPANRFDGGTGNDTLTGNGGNDVLKGGNSNDAISGGLGIDTLTGGLNNDYFVFNTAPNSSTNQDIIADFNHVNDAFRLENAIFTKLGAAGMLNPAFFRAGAAALDANDYVVYRQATGILSYDSNGNAAGGAVQLAVLANKPALAANDFVVI